MQKRNINFDILRTILMFMIVIWHAVVHGMIADSNHCLIVHVESLSDICRSFILYFILYVTSVSVNCFVLISGYFSIYHNRKIGKLIILWTVTVFYGLLFYFVGVKFGFSNFNLSDMLLYAMPVQANKYWFMTQYLGLMLISPYLNKWAMSMDKKTYTKALFVLGLLVLSFIQIKARSFPYGHIFTAQNHLMWFIYLYMVGAYFRLYNPFTKKHYFGKVYLGASALIAFLLVGYAAVNYYFLGKSIQFTIIEYSGITFFLSCTLFLWCKNMHFKPTILVKILLLCSPYVFGVYLIHDSAFMEYSLWHEWLHLGEISSILRWAITLLSYCFTIFVISTIIEFIRKKLFNLLKIEYLIMSFSEKEKKYICYLYNKWKDK